MNRGVSSIQVWPVVWIQMIFLVIQRRLRILKLLSIRLVSFFIFIFIFFSFLFFNYIIS